MEKTERDTEVEALRAEVKSLRALLASYEGSFTSIHVNDERWRSLLDSAPDYIIEFDRDYRILYINRVLPQLKIEEVLGSSLLDFSPPGQREAQKKMYDEFFSDGRLKSYESTSIGPHGKSADYLNIIGPVYRNGELSSAVMIARDITTIKERENALRDSRARFFKIFHSCPAAMGINTIHDGRILDANDRLCELLGYEREELLGHTVVELGFWVNPDERVRVLKDLQHEGKLSNILTKLRRKNGDVRDVLLSMEIAPVPGDSILIAMLMDVTEQRKAEQALRESEERLRVALQASQLGTWEWDVAGNVIHWDDVVHGIFGVPLGTFDGSFNTFMRFVHPEDSAYVTSSTSDSMNANGSFGHEYRIVRSDGSTRWVATFGKGFRNESGALVRMMGVLQDITARKSAELELATLNDQLLMMLKEARMAAYSWDVEKDTITGIGSLGFDVPKAAGDVLKTVHPDDRVVFTERLNASLRLGGERNSEHRLQLPSGECRWVLDKGHVTLDAQGQPRRMSGVVIDITARKQLEEQLLQAQKMESIGRLAGGIAHDFNNLLTVVLSSVEALVADEPAAWASEKKTGHLNNIRESANRAAALTSQLLAFARKQMIQPHVLNLNDLAKQMETLLRSLIGEDIKLVSRFDPGLGCVKVDRTQIEQLIMNLAVNARDAMTRGGTLSIETRNVELAAAEAEKYEGARPGPHVVLAVSDTGTGMTGDVQKHLFEPFFTTKEVGRGTGLGLATCYGVVRQNGGHIRVQSELGRGSLFEIYLPRVDDATPLSQLPAPALPVMGTGTGTLETAHPARAGIGTETVLLVEDEKMLRSINAAYLRHIGYRVIEAADGEEALRLALVCETPIQMLVTDLVMPRIGGEELVSVLTPRYPSLRVLFVSGYAERANLACASGQPYGYLQKPFTLTALALKLREVLDATTAGRTG